MNKIENEKLTKTINLLLKKYSNDRSSILEILNELTKEYRTISPFMIQELAIKLKIHPSELDSVLSFYSFLPRKEILGKYVIKLCKTISCDIKGKSRIKKQFENELGIKFGETTENKEFSLKYCNCLGMCDQGPALMLNDILISKLKASDVPLIIEACKNNKLEKTYINTIVSNVCKTSQLLNQNFVNGQSLKKMINKKPEDIIKIIEDADLRGRGGAGFSTAKKWGFALSQRNKEKYVVCNADEGEPGTFKDRYLLHKKTNEIIEGMTIAAYTIGASKGFIYLRGEYFYLKDILETVINKRKKEHLLGKKILGNINFNFDIEIRLGAGAYICGEETALIESLEGYRGEPRNRPPYPVDTGFKDQATIVNNVETFLDVCIIADKGASFFKEKGTSISQGTKLFSISGDCEKQGIYELPFGISIKELLDKVGVTDVKAVQIGGAAGQCIGEKDFEKIIAYEAIPTGGSIIIFNHKRDILDIAENFMEFFVEESCGQCTPCREGNVKILDGIQKLKKGECSITYLNQLLDLSETMKISSKCGLGQSSSKTFVSIITNFKDEVLGRLPKGEI